ncbi:MAG: amidohydrolase, partial [Verrucomicrobiae bacterium]|nr:amidohydrolase [Verrucomicrobiae bacterium]
YPNLYGDLSGFNIPVRARLYRRARQSPLVERLIHGSDFPVPTMPMWPWLWRQLSWRTYRQLARIANPLERDYQTKRTLGFPPATFTRITALIPVSSPGQTKAEPFRQ